MDSSERRRVLEEATRLLESARTTAGGGEGFDHARMDGHITTALTATRAALALANHEEPAQEIHDP